MRKTQDIIEIQSNRFWDRLVFELNVLFGLASGNVFNQI